jgi:hypothetical protein
MGILLSLGSLNHFCKHPADPSGGLCLPRYYSEVSGQALLGVRQETISMRRLLTAIYKIAGIFNNHSFSWSSITEVICMYYLKNGAIG